VCPGLLGLMFNGPAETLALTRHAQPALLLAGVAVTEYLRARGVAPSACAGHSLGELTALVGAGALAFEEALRLVEARGRCMSEDVPEGTMAAVIGLDAPAIEKALPEGVSVANYNGPGQTIISGTKEGVAAAESALKEAGAKRVMPLPVSGPFHSPLMQGAAARFREVVATARITTPGVTFVSSVSGVAESDPERIRELLAEQITSPVRWTEVMAALGSVPAVEAGPGKVLQGIAKRTENAPDVRSAGTVEAASAVAEAMQ
jgi:[acyl-carrier-protein] S-malonyltransferase